MIKNLKTKYRIKTRPIEYHLFYKVEKKVWWCPFWIEMNFYNSHHSIEAAEIYIKNHNLKGRVVKYIEAPKPSN